MKLIFLSFSFKMCVTYGGNNIAVFVDIALSYKDKILIKNLHLARDYNARKSRSLLVDFLHGGRNAASVGCITSEKQIRTVEC